MLSAGTTVLIMLITISVSQDVLRSIIIAQAELLIETCLLSVPLHFLKCCCFAAGDRGSITPAVVCCHCGKHDRG